MPDEGFDLRRALEELLSTGRLSPIVRPEIAASWRRSVASDLRPDRFDVPFVSRPRADPRLERAARPVLDRLIEDLAPATMALVLSDSHGTIVERLVREEWLTVRLDGVKVAPGYCHDEGRVGTNAIGTALALRAPSTVIGGEHFADALTDMASAAAPILDPADASVVGAVGLTCPAVGSHALMLTVAKRAAGDIEQRLGSAASPADRVLLDSFMTARRGARGALVALNGRAMYTNAPAVRLVADIDRAVLWGLVTSALANRERAEVELPMPRGERSLLSCEAITHGVAVAGALLRVLPQSDVSPASPPVPDRPRRSATMGWESLTETERGIAVLVSEGRTNRQIAAASFLSPHTVGYHLRHIFYKLGVSSRVELTRVVVQRDRDAE
jgi:transcriptional regulator of acetoin/glycerol metabolism/DNA-binding CsgD family transcriptional regulator